MVTNRCWNTINYWHWSSPIGGRGTFTTATAALLLLAARGEGVLHMTFLGCAAASTQSFLVLSRFLVTFSPLRSSSSSTKYAHDLEENPHRSNYQQRQRPVSQHQVAFRRQSGTAATNAKLLNRIV